MLRSLDAFARPIEGLRKPTKLGGIISLLAYIAAALLLLSQLALYGNVETKQYLQMAKSQTSSHNLPMGIYQAIPPASPRHYSKWEAATRAKIPITFHVTFPHVSCQQLEVAHDDARGDQFQSIHGKGSFQKYIPTAMELKQSGMSINEGDAPSKRESIDSKLFQKALDKARELVPSKLDSCTIRGKIMVPKVGGMISIGITPQAWQEVVLYLNTGLLMGTSAKMLNVSHFIHSIEFGERFPLHQNPLQNQQNVFQNEMGLGVEHITVKLVNTQYKRAGRLARDTYQTSVAQHMVGPSTLAAQQSMLLPGLVIYYDFTPLAVHHLEVRENFFVFLGSLISIVGGTIVTVGLVSRCLVGAASVAKKKD